MKRVVILSILYLCVYLKRDTGDAKFSQIQTHDKNTMICVSCNIVEHNFRRYWGTDSIFSLQLNIYRWASTLMDDSLKHYMHILILFPLVHLILKWTRWYLYISYHIYDFVLFFPTHSSGLNCACFRIGHEIWDSGTLDSFWCCTNSRVYVKWQSSTYLLIFGYSCSYKMRHWEFKYILIFTKYIFWRKATYSLHLKAAVNHWE